MKLTKIMRATIIDRIIAKVRPPRELKLRAREQALALQLVRHRYGKDVFDRCRALPDGWLAVHKHVAFDYRVVQVLPRRRTIEGSGRRHWEVVYPKGHLELAEYAPLPNSVSSGWDRETIGEKLFEDLVGLFQGKVDLEVELSGLRQQIAGTLAAFTTVERLSVDWPEGYAELPAEMMAPKVPEGLPAPRIADVNERIAALREAA